MTTATAKPTKTEQIKTTIMNLLNGQESATRKEIDAATIKMASARTVSRGLAALRLDGRINQLKDGASYSWISLESPTPKTGTKPETVETKTDAENVGSTMIPAKDAKDAKKANTKKDTDPTKDPKTADAAPKKGTKKNQGKKPDTKKGTPAKTDKERLATKIDPKDGKFFGFNQNEILLGIYLTKKEAKTDLVIYTKESGNSATFLSLDQLTHIQKIKLGVVEPGEEIKKITKKNLVDAGKAGVKRNPGPGKPKAKKTGESKPGIIATIIKSISKKAKTKKQILAKLVAAFPERDASKMTKTTNVQVPSRLRKDKGLNVQKSDKGYLIAEGIWKAPK